MNRILPIRACTLEQMIQQIERRNECLATTNDNKECETEHSNCLSYIFTEPRQTILDVLGRGQR